MIHKGYRRTLNLISNVKYHLMIIPKTLSMSLISVHAVFKEAHVNFIYHLHQHYIQIYTLQRNTNLKHDFQYLVQFSSQ